MQPHVAYVRSQDRRGRHGPRVLRLVDVAEPHPVVKEGADGLLRHPAAVAHLRDQRKLVEGPAEVDEELPILCREPERPGKLHQQGAKFLGSQQRPQPFLEKRDAGWVQHPFMCEILMELGREREVRIGLHLLHP